MLLLANSVLVGVLTPTTYDVDVDDDVVYDTSSCPLNMWKISILESICLHILFELCDKFYF